MQNVIEKDNIKFKLIIFFICMFFYANAYAVSFDEAMVNIQHAFAAIADVVMVVSFVAGVYFIMRGLMMLKAFGMPLTQMTRPGELGGPLGFLVIGALFLYLPTTIEAGVGTIFGSVDEANRNLQSLHAANIIYGYGDSATINERWEIIKGVVYKYISLIGLIAFVRGLFIMSKAGNPGVQAGTVSKGLIHLIAGVIAINARGFVDILKNTIGL